jgi:DNA polymerase III subunit delta
MIVSIVGSNHYLMRRRLDELRQAFIKDYGELAVERIDAEEAEAQAIIDAIQSLPFLATKKMVIVRGLGSNKTASEQIEQIIDVAGDSTKLVLYEPITDKRTAYYKTLKAKTNLEEYQHLGGPALAKWLVEEAKKQQGELSIADANYLVERIGPNQEQLANEITKLVLYEPKITRQQIDELTEAAPQSKIFELLDASFAGDKRRALNLYEDQRAQRVEPQAILAMIAWQLQILSLAKLGKDRQPEQIAKDAGISPYPVIKASRIASRLTDNKLREMVNEAYQIDYKYKTSGVDLDEALKAYIVSL